MDASPEFERKNFEVLWDSLDEDQRADLLSRSRNMPPSLRILPVIPGILSFHFNIRAEARKHLAQIQSTVNALLEHPREDPSYMEGLRESASVSARLYAQLSPEMPFNETSFFFKTLLEFGDNGAYFAFKAVLNGAVSMDVITKAVYMVTEGQRLAFVDQYIQATPEIRLRFGRAFKKILVNIKNREPVIDFFAALFDKKRDADPFLNNIHPDLLSPDAIIGKEIRSESPSIKIKGLKALSMLIAKVPSNLLRNALENEEVKKVRLAVYDLVESSSLGLYPELFDLIYNRFVKADKHEAINAFKALAVTGKMPLYELIGMVRRQYPDLMPNIHIEIAKLSRLSFFVIQDIALNKAQYQQENYDINLACVLGMIKKRPERVVKIMQAYDRKSGNGLKVDVSGFMDKTRKLLHMEKKDIESRFESITADLTRPREKRKPILTAMFQDPLKKKMDTLRKNEPQKSIDFQDATIENENLSGLRMSASTLFFNGAALKNCDLSASHIERAYFTQSVIYNIKWYGAVVRDVNFDGAVFINVDARKTRFSNCSFQGAAFFNCNFNQADLSDAVFVGATISKTAFGNTNLACACFAHARISGASFATACLDQADASHVSARFSRFPSYARYVMRSHGIDYNARQYQLSFNDLPHIDKAVVSEINMLIFCEFIHYGEMKFLNQNKLSLLTAFDMFKPSQADFFQVIPLLLHENVQIPDARSIHSQTPCGIADYLPSKSALRILKKFANSHTLKANRNVSPYIEGVFTMGSVGSLAQTQESDIDYWICINEEIMSAHELNLFRQKLDTLEKWALEQFKIQITFFEVDIEKARNNDFGGSTQESSGSAQSRLLKEEFYRTMIHVAGKLPLWAVLPTPISLNYYHMILTRIDRFARSHRYIDLGDIHAIPVNEFFGASIWQMFKWLKSPFKSVMKMALLEKYIQSYGKESLLCNQYKNEWMNSGTHLKLAQNDSYIILLNNLLDYYVGNNDEKSSNLMLTCFFLKLGIAKETTLSNTVFGLRQILVKSCLDEWGWDLGRLYEIGRFKEWDYHRIQRLSASIERYMLFKYNKVKKNFEARSQGLMISDEDRRVLERKVDIVFLDKPLKIKKILLVARSDRLFSRLHVKHVPEPGTPGRWELFHKQAKIHHAPEETLLKTRTIEEIGAWLINNSLYTDQTVVSLVPNPTPVTHDDIQKLFRAMYEFFDTEVHRTVRFNELRKQQPRVACLFININFYTTRQETLIRDYCAVYVNSWGEMFYHTAWPGKTFQSLDAAKLDILTAIGLKKFPVHTSFYFSKGMIR